MTRFHSTDGEFHLRISEVVRGPGEGHFIVEYTGQKPVIDEELQAWVVKTAAWEERQNQMQE